jgi:ribonuclease HI
MIGKFEGWFDGSSKPNPGQMKIGGYIQKDGKTLYQFSKDLGLGTNNQAEYLALMHLCTGIAILGIKEIDIKGDSMLVVNQINQQWKCKDENIKRLRDKCLRLLDGVRFNISHVPRNQNKTADSLTR